MTSQKVPSIVAETDAAQLLHLPGDSAFSVVFWGTMFSRANGSNFWGLAVARKLGIDAFGVMPTGANWFPDTEMEAIVSAVKARRDRPLLGYGASMGAYGALRYGAMMGADVTVAFSPQISIDPSVIGKGDIRYNRFFEKERHNEARILPQHLTQRSIILYDPTMKEDAAQIALLPEASGLTFIRLPFVGHQSVEVVASTQILGQVIDLARTGGEDEIRRLLLPRRRLSHHYFQQISRFAMGRKQPNRAITLLDEGVRQFKDQSEGLRLLRARAFHQAGKEGEALQELTRLIAANARDPRIYLMKSQLLQDAGHFEEALRALDAAPKETIVFHVRRSEIFEEMGKLPEAIKEIESFLKSRHNAVMAARLGDLRDRL